MDCDSDININKCWTYELISSILYFYLLPFRLQHCNASDLYFECMLVGIHMNVLFHFRVKQTFDSPENKLKIGQQTRKHRIRMSTKLLL